MTTKTYRLRAADIDRAWQVVDAADRPLGRVASEAAHMLLGKHKPTYEPHLSMGDHVIVVNAGQVVLTGNKAEQKVYYRHSGYPGGLRTRSFEVQMQKDPTRVLERAIRGMLPHTSLGRELFRHLRVYAGADHPHTAQVMAGTGERARKRVSRDEREAAAARERAAARPARPAAPAAASATP
ncbi:MAG: 50S ribosomal protein L13, partial [Dehalococcoidia bacterium]